MPLFYPNRSRRFAVSFVVMLDDSSHHDEDDDQMRIKSVKDNYNFYKTTNDTRV